MNILLLGAIAYLAVIVFIRIVVVLKRRSKRPEVQLRQIRRTLKRTGERVSSFVFDCSEELQLDWARRLGVEHAKQLLSIAHETLGRRANRSIKIHVGPYRAPYSDEDVHVHFPLVTEEIAVRWFQPEIIGSAGEIPALAISKSGVPIENDRREVLAEFVDERNFVLHFDVRELHSSRRYVGILESAALLYGLSRAQYERALALRRAEAAQEARVAYERQILARQLRRLDELRGQYLKADAALDEVERGILRNTQRSGIGEVAMQIAAAQVTEAEQRWASELDKIRQLPKVKIVQPLGTVVRIFTEMLTVPVPGVNGERREIGEFRIDLYTDGTNGCVRWANLTRRVTGIAPDMHAPNVLASGEALIGPISELIPTLLGRLEIAQAARAAVMYIQRLDASEPYARKLAEWPLVQTT